MKKWLAPKELEKHRETNKFHALFCLCAILEEDIKSTEAVFLMDAKCGWMIQCAKSRCGYMSKNAHLLPYT